jgi:hypothetical protein
MRERESELVSFSFKTVFQAKRSRIVTWQDEISPQYFESNMRHASQKDLGFLGQSQEEAEAAFRRI